MIPKRIHYCWFGKGEMPELALKCIDSWHRFMPDYEFKLWNEDNSAIDSNRYAKEAYEARKYAFVSDYARFWILYKYGGVYFDTDVEAIKPMEDIIARGPFMGLEIAGESGKIAPGLGLAVEAGNQVYNQILDGFTKLDYYLPDGSRNPYTMIPLVTDIMRGKGLTGLMDIQDVQGIFIYAPDYFNPLDDATGRLRITDNTRTIHWFMKSWVVGETLRTIKIKRLFRRVFGNNSLTRIKRIFK